MRALYRLFREIKRFLIIHKPPFLTAAFFAMLPALKKVLCSRKRNWKADLDARIYKQIYFSRYSRLKPPFLLNTEHPVAVYSDDHIWPHGSASDNSANRLFNLKLYDLLKYKPDIKLLDFGCSGGAFVKSVLDDGYTAIGLEGSDVSKKLQNGEWDTIPLHLFTCDITRPFTIIDCRETKVSFDVITAWEVLEHIPRDVIPGLIENICGNLLEGGYFIASVATFPEANPNLNAVYHVTLESREWWLSQFTQKGLVEVTDHKFQTRDWVRGNGLGCTNWDPKSGDGFHLVLRKAD